MSTSSQEPGFLQNTTEGISNMAQNVSDGIGKGLDVAKSNVNQAVNSFASNDSIQASSSFLNANTIVAKFAFLIPNSAISVGQTNVKSFGQKNTTIHFPLYVELLI